eukprot:5706538-Pleurochrysis_carterae.AAC.3
MAQASSLYLRRDSTGNAYASIASQTSAIISRGSKIITTTAGVYSTSELPHSNWPRLTHRNGISREPVGSSTEKPPEASKSICIPGQKPIVSGRLASEWRRESDDGNGCGTGQNSALARASLRGQARIASRSTSSA